MLPNDALEEGSAILTTLDGAQLLVVPGWEPAEPDRAQVQVAGETERWIPADDVHAGRLFDGTPFVALTLEEGVLGEGERVQAVGVTDGATVVPHDLDKGVQLRTDTL